MDWKKFLCKLREKVEKLIKKEYSLIISTNVLEQILSLYDSAMNGSLDNISKLNSDEFVEFISLLRKTKILTIYNDTDDHLICHSQFFPTVFSGITNIELIGCPSEMVCDLPFLNNQIVSLIFSKPLFLELSDLDDSFEESQNIVNKNWSILKRISIKHGSLSNVRCFPKYFENINKMDLSDNLIINPDLSNLKNVTYLNLSTNFIQKIPYLQKLSNTLTVLILSNNNLTDIEGLGCLKNLRTLYICDNFISNFQKLLDLSQLQFLVNLNLKGNPVYYQNGYRIRICSILARSIITTAHFKLDNKKLNTDEIIAIATYKVGSPNLIRSSSAIICIHSDNISDINILSASPIKSNQSIENVSSENYNHFELTKTVDNIEEINCIEENTRKLCFSENDINFVKDHDHSKEEIYESPEQARIPDNISINSNKVSPSTDTGFYSVRRIDSDAENDEILYIKIVGQDLNEYSKSLEITSELDLRYLSEFEYNEKNIIKINFNLQNPQKKHRCYLVEEDEYKFYILVKKMSIFYHNYKRRNLNTNHAPTSYNTKCPKCGCEIDSFVLFVCPNCNALLPSIDNHSKSSYRVDYIGELINSSDSVSNIPQKLMLYLNTKIFNSKSENYKFLIKSWYVNIKRHLYIPVIIILTDMHIYVCQVVLKKISTSSSQLETIVTIQLKDIHSIRMFLFKNILVIKKLINSYTFIVGDSKLNVEFIQKIQNGDISYKINILISDTIDLDILKSWMIEINNYIGNDNLLSIQYPDQIDVLSFNIVFYYDPIQDTFKISTLLLTHKNIYIIINNYINPRKGLTIIQSSSLSTICVIETYENNFNSIAINVNSTTIESIKDECKWFIVFPTKNSLNEFLTIYHDIYEKSTDKQLPIFITKLNQVLNIKSRACFSEAHIITQK